MGIAGKVVAVTGASSGIGLATAQVLARAGASVLLAARSLDRLEEHVAALRAAGFDAEACRADVTQRADVDALVFRAVERFGRLDVLVSNAGISKLGPVADGDVEGWDAMLDINLRAVLFGVAAAMPVFRRQGAGHFVTVASTSGLHKIAPDQAMYSATKNAVRTLMEGLRGESTDGTIRTTTISPGYVRTNLADSVDDAAVRAQIEQNMAAFAISPDAVANAIAYAIDQPDDVEISELTIRPSRQS